MLRHLTSMARGGPSVGNIMTGGACAGRWWPRAKAIAAVAALVAVLAAGWATGFRYPVRRLSGPNSA
jgi:hypothetical protein